MSVLGEIFLDLLEQDRVWRTADGRIIPLEEMEPGHRAAVLNTLVRMGPDLYADWLAEDPLELWVGFDEFDPYADEWTEPHRDRARRWLEEQPLLIRLPKLQAFGRTRRSG